MVSRSIRTTILIIVAAVVILIQSALFSFIASATYKERISSQMHEMELTASTIAKSCDDFGAQQSAFVRGISKMPAIRQLLLTGEGKDQAAESIAALSCAAKDINTLYVFDKQGKQVLMGAQGKLGDKLSDLSSREYVQAALMGNEGYSTAPTKSIATGKLIVSVTAPVLDKSGAPLGGVGMSYVLDGLIEQYIASTLVGKTGRPFILSPKGVVVADANPDLLLKDVSREPGIAPMLQALDGTGAMVRDGKEKKAVWQRVRNWQWILGFAMDTEEIEAPAKAQRNLLIWTGLGAVLALIMVTLFALERIAVRPLKRIEAFASGVAAGNLDTALSYSHTNEIGKLADSLRTMVQSLKGKIAEADEKTRLANEESARAAQATRQAEEAQAAAERAKTEGMLQAATHLEDVVQIVTSASERLSAQIEQSNRGAQQQSSRASETATAMEEMNSTVLEVARNASQAAESADTTKTRAVEGASIVTQVMKSIGEVQTRATGLKSDMTALGKQAESIGQILNVISDIADQTNLLALNAAIEAARAGDAGRGFAVVADEVRKLAEKTMTATKEVDAAIRGIQDGTRKNVDNVEQAVSSVASATELAGKSGHALEAIVELVEQTSEQVRSIATAAEEQSAASEEINHSIEDINRISSETSEGMENSARAVAELAEQTQALHRLIRNLKEGDGGTSLS